MNVNTRSESITLNTTERNWMEQIRHLANSVAVQSFVKPEAKQACIDLAASITMFEDMVRRMSPKKEKQKTFLEAADVEAATEVGADKPF